MRLSPRRCRSVGGFWQIAVCGLLLIGVSLGCASRSTWNIFSRCPTAANPPSAAPLLWRAQSDLDGEGRGVLYLFGSVHFGTAPPKLNEVIEAAYDRSAELIVEIDAQQIAAASAATLGQLEPPRTLADWLAPATLDRLAALLESLGRSYAWVEHSKPWLATNKMVAMQLEAAGYRAEYGIDRYFLVRAKGRKPVRGLETAAAQLELFDGMPFELQVTMLEDALAKSDEFVESTRSMFRAWQIGDERTLATQVFEPRDTNPEFAAFYDAIFDRRNRTMSQQLVRMSRDGQIRFVVLGAGHMVGDTGIPAQLCEAGFSVERLSGGG